MPKSAANSLDLHDYQVFHKTPLLQTLHKCHMKSYEELAFAPMVLIDGCDYETPRLVKRGSNPIFRKHRQGACSSKSKYDKAKNQAHWFDTMVHTSVSEMECESDNLNAILGNDLFTEEKGNQIENIYDQLIQQLYKGRRNESEGFGGLPDAVCYKIDALDPEWNGAKDFTPDIADKEDCLYSIYLVRVAEQSTRRAPGVKWLGGNNAFIKETPLLVENQDDPENPGCKYLAATQHLQGHAGFAHTCPLDVVEIANVPAFVLDGFYLQNVLAKAMVLYPSANLRPNRILIHELAYHAFWEYSQRTNNDRNSPIVCCDQIVDNGFGRKAVGFYDGRNNTPFVFSQCMPATGLQDGTGETLKQLFEKTRDVDQVCLGGSAESK
ncbi:MAG: hypothetical protein AAF236_11125 [Verrucomicrobiota bacterium]